MTAPVLYSAGPANPSAISEVSGGPFVASPSISHTPAWENLASYAPVSTPATVPTDVGNPATFPVAVPQKPVRGKAAARTLPKSVSIFGLYDEDTRFERFETPVGAWGIYLPLKRVSELLGISPILIERTMRRVSKSGMYVLPDVSDKEIREPKGSIMDERSLAEYFGDRDRILVDVLACFLALSELLKTKRQAEVRNASRRRRVTEEADDFEDGSEP